MRWLPSTDPETPTAPLQTMRSGMSIRRVCETTCSMGLYGARRRQNDIGLGRPRQLGRRSVARSDIASAKRGSQAGPAPPAYFDLTRRRSATHPLLPCKNHAPAVSIALVKRAAGGSRPVDSGGGKAAAPAIRFVTGRSGRLERPKLRHLEAVNVLFRVPEIICHLVAQPRFRSPPSGHLAPERHVRRNPVTSVEQLRQGLTRHAQPLRRCRHREVEGLQAVL